MIIIHLIILVITFYLLAIVCDKYFVDSLEHISDKLKLSKEVTGATFMAVGSSAPELFTSIFALFAILGSGNTESSIGAGTIVGSAIFNVLIIIGATAVVIKKNNAIKWKPIMRDLIFYSLTIILLFVTFWDGVITFYETIIFVSSYILYIFVVKNWSKWLNYDENLEVPDIVAGFESKEEEVRSSYSWLGRLTTKVFDIIIPNPKLGKNRFYRTFLVSIILIALLSHFMVESAVSVASYFGISQAIIGLTILAAGTSIPDLISSVIVSKKGHGNMSISNALGSNIFDILFGLGFVYFVYFLIYGINNDIVVDKSNLLLSIGLLFGSVLVIFLGFLLYKWKLKKGLGWILILIYLVYLIFNLLKVRGVL
ncbi:MAG TPA: calcium/sodium antiporter [Candidatus Absconditabacterales bacterium]|nr:calcium/sodium antiporter [Candidatus Absconditabacterales bacterium]